MRVRWLGTVPYREAWDLQRTLGARADEDYLLLLEHPPVYTLGRSGDPAHVLVDPARVGAELVRVDRGGDVTFHGPGQLVGYPLVTVGSGPHHGPAHVHAVEQVVLDALARLGVAGPGVGRRDGFPGVWVGTDGATPRKLAAVGVRTAHGRTLHGFALNVTTDLSMFDHIVPCGLTDAGVTSLAAEGVDVPLAAVVDAVTAAAAAVWGPVTSVQRVTDGASAAPPGGVPVRMGPVRSTHVERRLRRAGVDPAAGLPVTARKPGWLRARVDLGERVLDLRRDLRADGLVTVCEEAGCPNLSECWSDGTATFMINGGRCTRSCAFCQVDTGRPDPLDPGEPGRVAEAVARMGLAHAVITCVARDDLADGGAAAFAETVAAVRRRAPDTAVEVLISDLRGDRVALERILAARPDVLNHNLETVARLQRAVRPSAGYARSLTVLARAADAGLSTKSGIILGMGERDDEVLAALGDLRSVGVSTVTLGQYLRPSARHLPVARWWTPDEFDDLAARARALGFAHVQASPLTRSSYHARDAARAASGPAVPVGVGR